MYKTYIAVNHSKLQTIKNNIRTIFTNYLQAFINIKFVKQYLTYNKCVKKIVTDNSYVTCYL